MGLGNNRIFANLQENPSAVFLHEKLLEGFGSMMAANEIVSHCEMLIKSGDVVSAAGNKYVASGSTKFEKYIHELKSDY